ncbi:hypothetical protein WN944_010421 [Citrus x changshan-huyou]|uniref:Uncharacterized protein n=1 Tax=Citrus x changshan-huyou TaxID=2935761 RepID=A0AAP0MU26_9ROSI
MGINQQKQETFQGHFDAKEVDNGTNQNMRMTKGKKWKLQVRTTRVKTRSLDGLTGNRSSLQTELKLNGKATNEVIMENSGEMREEILAEAGDKPRQQP